MIKLDSMIYDLSCIAETLDPILTLTNIYRVDIYIHVVTLRNMSID